jgi:hypothetical protein
VIPKIKVIWPVQHKNIRGKRLPVSPEMLQEFALFNHGSIAKWLSIVVLAVVPSIASAGPITWSYRTQITYAQNYGDNFRVMVNSGDTLSTLPGELGFVNLFTSTANPRPQAGSYEVNYDFQATVTITDVASGQSIDQVWSGWYSSQWSYPPDLAHNPDLWRWDYEGSGFGDFWDRRSFQLGSNRYTVWAHGGGQGQNANGELAVSAVQTTPEPGTLALAGLGIATLVLGRKRIRQPKDFRHAGNTRSTEV